jgi:hypothetical protein
MSSSADVQRSNKMNKDEAIRVITDAESQMSAASTAFINDKNESAQFSALQAIFTLQKGILKALAEKES